MVVRTYGNISFDKEKKQWIITNAEPHICLKLKAIFSKLSKTAKTFEFIDSAETCHDLVWFMERYPLSISDADLSKLKREKKKHISTINELESILLPDYKPQHVQLKDGFEGRDYQLKGVDIYLKTNRILIGDDLGIGKTMIAILSCLHKNTTPCLVVVQTHMPTQWKEAIELFTNLRVHIMKGTRPYNLPVADIYITKYSCLAGWIDVFRKGIFKSVVFDEIQELRHGDTARYAGAEAASENAKYVLGLSATPIYNFGDEIFNILNLIKPGCLGNRYDFLREWTNYGRVVEHPKALGTYLRENFLMLRRTRKEVGRELPPINKIVHTVGYDENEVKKSEDLVRQLAIKVTSGSFTERGQAARELDMLARQSTGVSKAREVAAFVKILLENGEPVILAGWHRDVYEIWLEELKEYNPVMYTGSETSAQKEKAKQDFIDGKTNLFIISLRSGVGIDGLQHRCHIVVIGELDWSPQVVNQLVGRADRDGQKEQVTVIYLVSDYGSDPLIIDMLGVKSSQSHNILNPLTAVDVQYSDESRIKLLAERFLSKKKDVIKEETTT